MAPPAQPEHDAYIRQPTGIEPSALESQVHDVAHRNGTGAERDPVVIAHDALSRGDRGVLEPAEIALPSGSIVALAGANGAGKSTLFLALAGALLPRSGSAHATRTGRRLRTIGFVPQQPALPGWATGGELAAIHGVAPLLVAGAPESLELAELLALRADVLSAGQTQTVAVALALLRADPLLLLDEPFASVDLHHRLGLRELLRWRQARRPGGVVVISSHAAGELHALCDWVLTLRQGRYTFAGSRMELESGGQKEWEAHESPEGSAARFERRLTELTR